MIKKIAISVIIAVVLLMPVNSVNAHHFPDLSPLHFAYQSIHNLSEANIINGFSDGTFRPNANVTRAQAALILFRSLQIEPDTSFESKFKDLPKTHYAHKEITSLTERGVFSNVEKFNPEHPLTRSQMAKIIIEGFNVIVDSNHQVDFLDVSSKSWAHDYIVTLAEVGITKGATSTTFQPNEIVTRAQLAAFIERALKFKDQVDSGTIFYDETSQSYKGIKSIAQDSIDLVNIERTKNGLNELKEDPLLSEIAQLKSLDMVENKYFAHKSPTYGFPWEMALDYGYPTNQVGENLARGYITAEEAFQAWMSSDGHKENLLLADYTSIGVGYTEDEDGFPYWVHLFSIR